MKERSRPFEKIDRREQGQELKHKEFQKKKKKTRFGKIRNPDPNPYHTSAFWVNLQKESLLSTIAFQLQKFALVKSLWFNGVWVLKLKFDNFFDVISFEKCMYFINIFFFRPPDWKCQIKMRVALSINYLSPVHMHRVHLEM